MKKKMALTGKRTGTLLKGAAGDLVQNDGIEIGGFIAYTALVSLFPFTIFLFALAGFVGQTQLAEEFVTGALQSLPTQVADTLMPILAEILGTQKASLLTVGIIGTLWATSSGVEALRIGLNRAYDVKETRPMWKRRLHSFGFVVVIACVVLLASFLIIIWPVVLKWLSERMYIPLDVILTSNVVRYLATFGLLVGFMSVLYRYLPNRIGERHYVWPGALLATGMWVGMASLFSLYLVNFGNYSVTYGSLGGVVITLLFLHVSAIVFIFGAEFNGELTHEAQAKREAAAGPVINASRAPVKRKSR